MIKWRNTLKIQFLGTGVMGGSRKNTSFVINDSILVDIGSGVLNQLRVTGLDVEPISTLVVTHSHCDHFSELSFFLHRRKIKAVTSGILNNLVIVGYKGMCEDIIKLEKVFFGDKIEPTDLFKNVNFVELGHDEIYSNENVKITAFAVSHGDVSSGYIFDINGKTLGYSGDADLCDNLVNKIPCANNWIIEATRVERIPNWHLGLIDVEAFATRSPNKTFYVVHRSDYEPKSTNKNVLFPNDLDVVQI